jgi:hypothetical protein
VSRFIDEHRGRFGVEPICRVLDVSASAYYHRAAGQRSERAIGDELLVDQIRELHATNYYAYGYRKMWLALQRAGEHVGRDQVKRLMRTHGIQGAKRRGKPWRTTTPDPAATRSPDLVTATSRPTGPTPCGSRTSPMCAATTEWCASASSSTSTRGGSSAGSSRRTCAPTSFSMRCGWPSRAARRAPMSTSSTTQMPGRSPNSTGRRNIGLLVCEP